MVKNKNVKIKANFTVEAALLCPILCLMLCGMLLFTMELYQTVNEFATELLERQERELSTADLIRLEAVIEDLF
ncbi:MAG: hypothetical protein J6K04_13290 [Lachnospiraceae bacterium]|nr:hypothetical protein [Lachnospiraceae bacterium]